MTGTIDGVPTEPAPLLRLERLGRVLAGRRVVRDLDLTLQRGEILGLLGVNGAGKSTTLRMIAGILAPSSGLVAIGGRNLHEEPGLARRTIGYLPETPPLHGELTVVEYLDFCARLHGIAARHAKAAVTRAIERCDLGDVARRVIGVLSKGFRQRVGLAQAILHEPALIVLDEPASGLDPVQALRLREIVRSLGTDHAVILSTHVLPDVMACCGRVAILHEGVLRYEGAIAGLGDRGGMLVSVVRAKPLGDWLALAPVAAAEPIGPDETAPLRWRVRLRDGYGADALAAALIGAGFGLVELRVEHSALEETFMAIAAGAAAVAA